MIVMLFVLSLSVDYGLPSTVVNKLFCHVDEVTEYPWAATLASVMELQSFVNTGNILNLNPLSFVTGIEEYFDSRKDDLAEFEINNCLNVSGYVHPKCIMTYLNQTHPILQYNQEGLDPNLFIENVEKIELESLDDFIKLYDDPMKMVYSGFNGKNDETGIYTGARAIMSISVNNETGWIGYKHFNNQCTSTHAIFYNMNDNVFQDRYDILKDMYAFKISEVVDVATPSDDDSEFKSTTITLGVLLGVFVAGFSVVGALLLKKLNIICKNNGNEEGDDQTVAA